MMRSYYSRLLHVARLDVLNRSFRYQLTLIGHRAWGAQAIVWDRMKGNRFTIPSKAGVEISWRGRCRQRVSGLALVRDALR
jgi:hypothetical protein